MKYCIVTLILLFALTNTTIAHNTYFLPGDAFFFINFRERDIDWLEKNKAPIFSYGSPRDSALGCGCLGYRDLQLNNLNDETRNLLIEAFNDFRGQMSKDRIHREREMCSLFVYSAGYDWKKHGLALQYNENWADECVEFGVNREHAVLSTFSDNGSDVVKNWRDSALITPLSAKCPVREDPETEIGFNYFPWVKTPVTVDCQDVCFLLIPHRQFADVINASDKQTVIQIRNRKKKTFKRINGSWEEQPR